MKNNPGKNTKVSSALRTHGLNLNFQTQKGIIRAVENVDFELKDGHTTVILGESGCGKSSLARALLRLLPNNTANYDGEVWLGGRNIMEFSDSQFRTQVRWIKISLVPQAAMNSFNPVTKIAKQIAEPLLVHGKVRSKKEAMRKVSEVFDLVGVPQDFIGRYPFEFSGGMQQRAAIAMALVADPDVIIMDEPTSALDLLTQANIMNTLKKIKWETGVTYMLITHDVSTSSELADDIAVMYAAWIVERAEAKDFFDNPLHPYSKMLMDSVPRLHADKTPRSIPGTPPPLYEMQGGCRFAARCPERHNDCDREPPVFEPQPGRKVKCWLYKRN